MATTTTVLANRPGTSLDVIRAYSKRPEIVERFTALLGNKEDAQRYIESVLIATANSDELQKCSAKSIMISAMRAASLHLSVDPALKQAHLVGYAGEATLIPDYHGLVQLSEDTGWYEVPPNVFEVYNGENVQIDRFSGRVTITGDPIEPRTGIGWCGYFKAKIGTERFLYMTNEEADDHGKTYNPGGFNSSKSAWNDHGGRNRDKMRRKTVLRQLVSRWGHFSPSHVAILKNEVIDAKALPLPDVPDVVIEKPVKSRADIIRDLGYDDPDPEDELTVVGKMQKVLKEWKAKHKGATVTDQERHLLAAALDATFDGSKTMRYELCKGLVGVSSTSKMSAEQVKAFLSLLGVSSFDDAPSAECVKNLKSAHSEILKASGQAELFNTNDTPQDAQP